MYDRREVYSNPPLALVTAEVRYPYAPRLRQADTLDRIQLALEDELPIRKTEERATLEFTLAGGMNKTKNMQVYRYLDRTSTHSAVISPEAFTIETTRYTDFPDFLALLLKVATAIADEKAIPAIERVGIRYIDEIRVPEKIKDASQWGNWVAPALLPQLNPGVGLLKSSQGVSFFETGESTYLQFQYAAVDGAPIVSNKPLRRLTRPESGKFFVLDFDSFWQSRTPEDSRSFTTEFLEDTLTRLHQPTGKMFQAAITDRLRDLFRGNNGRRDV
ncbi:TIGR04255 family protein [Streptomyces europaeiscabiei]|uniref:TIGR04255 family protein n=1 Tax=Streptomyces europaeiscabiei TaxID=146819 RepID=A0ABU4NPV3_9ACTN|nr:TIGR04255 family protein [Streptomyces europaeiscabiei]MDX3548822.1 TIGR04255 family protein [Streptomyces europaeiscabiei]MDX3555124.1 TIGR04255 family protein [Streptomyces europaeiscabiei]MDX3705138.1 TIGR04255 family protein [Streptomyces europaeiscabiei]